jgi:LytS/YehU family sensor histidine kinase
MRWLKRHNWIVTALIGAGGGFALARVLPSRQVLLLVLSGAALCSVGSLIHLAADRLFFWRQGKSADHIAGPSFSSHRLSSLFLFNTLHNIAALSMIQPQQAGAITKLLADYIRLTFELEKNQFTLLSQEIKCVDLYLRIEQARLGNKFKVVYDIQRECLEAKVPALVLQEFVENAVRHGAERHSGKVDIIISAQIDNNRLILEVSDTGHGIDPGQVAKIFDSKKNLAKIFQQLTALYDKNFSLDIEPLVPSGTRISVKLPAQYIEEFVAPG